MRMNERAVVRSSARRMRGPRNEEEPRAGARSGTALRLGSGASRKSETTRG